MTKKNKLWKKVFILLSFVTFLDGMTISPSYALFDSLFRFFSSAKASDIQVSLHKTPTGAYEKDPLVYLGSFGKPVMLVVWAIGCEPCLKELVVLNRMAEKIRAQGADVVPVLLNQNWGGVVAFLTHMSRRSGGADRGWQDIFPNLEPYYDSQGQVGERFEIKLVPVVIFLDKNGKVVGQHEGYKQWDSAEGIAELEENLGIKLKEE